MYSFCYLQDMFKFACTFAAQLTFRYCVSAELIFKISPRDHDFGGGNSASPLQQLSSVHAIEINELLILFVPYCLASILTNAWSTAAKFHTDRSSEIADTTVLTEGT